jgi:hypothetical protein
MCSRRRAGGRGRRSRAPGQGSQRLQPARRRRGAAAAVPVRRLARSAGLRRRQQVAAEVAAVHRGHVGRQQRRAASGCRTSSAGGRGGAPAVQRGQRGLQPRQHRPVSIQPKARARRPALSRYRPMLVGEVRCASISCGCVCRLSGGRWWSAAPTCSARTAPGVARHAVQYGGRPAASAALRGLGAGWPSQIHSGVAAHSSSQTQRQRIGPACRRQPQHGGSSAAGHGSARWRRSTPARSVRARGLRGGGGGPLQQVAAADRAPVQRQADGDRVACRACCSSCARCQARPARAPRSASARR